MSARIRQSLSTPNSTLLSNYTKEKLSHLILEEPISEFSTGSPRTDTVLGPQEFVAPDLAHPLLQFFGNRKRNEIRNLEDRMEVTLREMGVTFDFVRGKSVAHPWFCDLLPHIFADHEWKQITEAFRQRLRAFECFLHDVYGPKEILRSGALPMHPILGSPYFQRVCLSLSPPDNAYIHLAGMAITRDKTGHLMVKNHYFSHASGIAYMMQNRRALARVIPEIFRDFAVASVAETPLFFLESLRQMSPDVGDPTVVLLSPGTGSAVYSEHSFLARRMGIPLVQGDDLLVLDDHVYLKTVSGLEQVDTIYTRVADAWLDPLVFRRDSRLGVPGLVHAVRKGKVRLVNAIGSQLADDRALLCFSSRIIRYYLGENPVLPIVPSYWMGDIDQREVVFSNLEKYRIRPLTGERVLGDPDGKPPTAEQIAEIRAEVKKHPHLFVAQEIMEGGDTTVFDQGKQVDRTQDHIVFATRRGPNYEVFPGALTRVSPESSRLMASELGGGSKDSWVSARAEEAVTISYTRKPTADLRPPPRQVTSRVADNFYWMGRYLERAHCAAYMVQIIETLEMEELTTAERKLYRPMWNRLLPPLESSSASGGRRGMTTALERYRLLLDRVPGTVVSTFNRAMHNAESLQESLSPEAWGTLVKLKAQLERPRFRLDQGDAEYAKTTRRVADIVVQLIPQFFAIAEGSMLADNGWKFCEVGQMVERAAVTANAMVSISKSLTKQASRGAQHAEEIELSAFLRLLGTRDAYRRVYQMRTAPAQVLEMLWGNPETPRSVVRCLQRCCTLLRESINGREGHSSRAINELEELIFRLKRINWHLFFVSAADDELARPAAPGTSAAAAENVEAGEFASQSLSNLLNALLRQTLDIHVAISDGFLSHQAIIAQREQLLFSGFK
ncbi:MAG TPA: circularly permuted type 2 ATP-grasp protein [Chthoniobacterales bacterium]